MIRDDFFSFFLFTLVCQPFHSFSALYIYFLRLSTYSLFDKLWRLGMQEIPSFRALIRNLLFCIEKYLYGYMKEFPP